MNSNVLVPIKGYENEYEISETGEIYSKNRVVKRKDGFLRKVNRKKVISSNGNVCLSKDNIHEGFSVELLVIRSFYAKEFNKNKHRIIELSKDKSLPILKRKSFVYDLKFNKVYIKDVITGKRENYKNVYELIDKYNIPLNCFFKIFSNNGRVHKNPFIGKEIYFQHPVYINNQLKIYSFIKNFSNKD